MPQTQEDHDVQEVVRAHAGWVFACAKRRVRDDALAEDVAQAAFILLWQKGASLGGEVKVTGWLYRAVRYCAGNALRLKQIRQRHEREAAMAALADGSAGEVEVDWNQVSPELEWAVDRLRDEDRSAVLLRFYRQMSFSEVGQALGITEEAAKKRVQRAVEKLRGVLAKKGVVAGAGALGAVMAENVTSAAPAGLVEAATAAAGGGGTGSAGVIAKGAMKMMAWAKIKVAAMVIGAILMAGGLAVVVGQAPTKPAAALLPGAPDSARSAAKSALQRYYDLIQDVSVQCETTVDYKYPSGFPGNRISDKQSWIVANHQWRFERQFRLPNAPAGEKKPGVESESVEVSNSGKPKSLTKYLNGEPSRGTIGGQVPVTSMPVKSMQLGFGQKPFYLLLDDPATTVTATDQSGEQFIVVKGQFESESASCEIWLSRKHSLFPARVIRRLDSHVTSDAQVTEWWETSQGSFPRKIHDTLFHATEDKVVMDCVKVFTEPQWHPDVKNVDFTLAFPNGIVLTHLDTGRATIVGHEPPETKDLGTVDSSAAASQPAAGHERRQEPEKSDAQPPHYANQGLSATQWWGVVALGVAVVVAAIFTRRANKRGQ